MVSCWISANRKYVGIGACLNMNVPLHGIVYNAVYIAPSELHTRLLLNYNNNGIRLLMLIKYVGRCHVGFGRTERTSVLVYGWIWLCYYVLYDARSYCCNCTLACYSNTLQWQWLTALHWCWCCLNTWNATVLALNVKHVRWHWCMFGFVLLGSNMSNAIKIAHSPVIQIQWQWNTTYGPALMLMLVEYIERFRVG